MWPAHWQQPVHLLLTWILFACWFPMVCSDFPEPSMLTTRTLSAFWFHMICSSLFQSDLDAILAIVHCAAPINEPEYPIYTLKAAGEKPDYRMFPAYPEHAQSNGPPDSWSIFTRFHACFITIFKSQDFIPSDSI
jgi:hypothetical protein